MPIVCPATATRPLVPDPPTEGELKYPADSYMACLFDRGELTPSLDTLHPEPREPYARWCEDNAYDEELGDYLTGGEL